VTTARRLVTSLTTSRDNVTATECRDSATRQ